MSAVRHDPPVDDVRVGLAFRAIRQRKRQTQEGVADLADVHQTTVSLLERGHLDELTLHTIRAIGAALDVSVQVTPRWRGGDLDRLLDARHAALVEAAAATLRSLGWVVLVEFTFSHFGERGSMDVAAWQPRAAALLLIEVKSRVVDVQDLLSTTDRKLRLVPKLLAAERGWRATSIGSVLLLPEGSRARNAVTRHEATFAARFPGRTLEVRRWLSAPRGPLAAIWFFPLKNTMLERRESPGRREPGPGESRSSRA